MNDLEWMARNVHEVPSYCKTISVVRLDSGEGRPFFHHDLCGTHSTQEWQSERARLQNKPNWEDAPKWATHLNQWPNGEWVWNMEEPKPGSYSWIYESAVATTGMKGEVLGDWRDTLKPRPEEQTMTKKEWKQDDLPPIGEECEVYRNGEWELCEIIAHIEQPMGTIAVFSYGREPGYGISGVDCLIPRYFRPVDVSRAEEDRAVEEMYRDATGDDLCGDEMDDQDVVSLCQILYKAGYRKQEPSE